MDKFKVGDHIVALEEFKCSPSYPAGSTGVLVKRKTYGNRWDVRMDINGRECGPPEFKFELVKSGRRRATKSTQLAVVEDITIK